MKKDVIYIDIEDDITAVIEKLKNSSEKIVALVPPKGNAVLQSVVNLKLLKRAAASVSKQPVLVTNNHALTALAGGLDLYVAKNLQSKPVLASSLEPTSVEDEPVEVSDEPTVDEAPTTVKLSDDDDSEVELSGDELAALAAADQASAPAVQAAKSKDGKAKKVPNFHDFRKKLLIGGAIVLLLLVAAVLLFGRSKSAIVVRAETTPVEVAFNANLNANSSQSDPASYNLKAQAQETKKTLSQSFSATGKKDVGEKATGRVRLTSDSFSALAKGITIPAGTSLKAKGGKVFITDEAARLSLSGNTASVDVTAAESGPSYNSISGSLSGAPSSVSATFKDSTSGGTTQVVQVVIQADVDKARSQLDQQDTNAAREELKKAFGDNVQVLDDSFTVTLTNVRSEPAVGEQADEAKLTAEATYTLLAVSKDDIGSSLDAFVTSKMTDKDQQRVYDNGLSNVKLEKVSGDGRTAVYKLSTIGQFGPQFDTEQLKSDVTGKKFGEVRSYLQDLPGVKGVDIKLSPFWARKMPNVNRITIKLDVDKNSGQ